MGKIKYTIYILLLTLTLSIYSCKTKEKTTDNIEINFGGQMYNVFENYYTVVQFDSICKADKISNNLNKWHKFQGRDGETKENKIIYMYIKSLGNSECVYRLVKHSEVKYKITKRITNR